MSRVTGLTTSAPGAGAVAPTVIATITAIPDQLDLSAVTLAVTVTVDGSPVTPDAVAWRVNATTTGIADATATPTTHTPTAGGVHVVTCEVEVDGRSYFAEAESYAVGDGPLSVSIAAVSDQLTLDAITLDSTVTGGVGSKTYSWTVNGATTGLSDATAADPTFTPTGGGKHVAVCTVTDAGGQTARVVLTLTVGVQGADGEWWIVDWELDPSEMADHDFKVGPLTHDGVTLTLDGTADTAEITSGVLTLKPTGPADIFLWSLGNEPSTVLGRDVCWMVAFGADLTANNDGVFILYGNSGTTVYGFAEARNVSGAQRVDMQRAGTTPVYDATAGGGQAQIVGLRLAGRYSMQCVYSETALSGGAWPAPSSMSKHDKVPSGWYTLDDSLPTDSADSLAAATDRVRVVEVRGDNARSYTITRLARLVRA